MRTRPTLIFAGWLFVLMSMVGRTPPALSVIAQTPPATAGTPPPSPITAANVGQLKPLTLLARGPVVGLDWSMDGKTLEVASPIGFWLYPADALSAHPAFISAVGGTNIYADGNSELFHTASFSQTKLKMAATAKYWGPVSVWNLDSGQRTGYLSDVLSLVTALSPDGTRVAFADHLGNLKLWTVGNGLNTQLIDDTMFPENGRLLFSPDGAKLAFNNGYELFMYDVNQIGQPYHPMWRNESNANNIAFSPDGKQLASADEDGTLRLWDAQTGAAQSSFAGPKIAMQSVAFSADGRYLAAGSLDGTVQIWDIAGAKVATMLGGHSAAVHFVAFSPDGQRLASGSADGTVRVWDWQKTTSLATLPNYFDADVVTFNHDGTRAATGGLDGVVRVWNVETGDLLASFKGHTSVITSLSFGAPGDQLASGSADGTVRLWNLTTLASVAILRHPQSVNSVAFSPDGIHLASGDEDAMVRVWDVTNQSVVRTLKGHKGAVKSVAYSPDGSRLASGGEDKTVRLWDIATGRLLVTFRGRDVTLSVTFNPSGSQVAATNGDGSIRLWSTQGWTFLKEFIEGSFFLENAVFSPNGKLLVSAGADLEIWDVATGNVLAKISDVPQQESSVRFSPDGTRLAFISFGGLAWVFGTGSPLIASP